MVQGLILRLEDLHPILQYIFNMGHGIEMTLNSTIKQSGEVKTALNLTDKLDPVEFLGYEFGGGIIPVEDFDKFNDPGTPATPIYRKEHRWRVNFDTEPNIFLCPPISMVLEGVDNEIQGLKDLKHSEYIKFYLGNSNGY